MRADSDFALVMNSVAALFLLDLDLFAYRIMLPPTIKNNTENAPMLALPCFVQYNADHQQREQRVQGTLRSYEHATVSALWAWLVMYIHLL